MNFFRFKTKFSLLPILFYGLFFTFSQNSLAQYANFKNIKSVNVGAQHETLVKVMFTTPKEEYFYSTFKNVKINKVNVSRLDFKIRKSDSVCVEVSITTSDDKSSQKLLKQVKQEFGEPENKVLTSATTYDWAWSDKKFPTYLESKSWHTMEDGSAYLKIILISQ